MKKKTKKFNLVEIIIAMGIVVVCITTIMGMFSYGMEVSNDAVMKSYSNNILEQLGGMVETYPGASDAVPTSEPYTSATAEATVTGLEAACTTAIDSNDPFFKNVYWDGTTMGTLKISYTTTINSEVTDFTAYAKLWYSESNSVIPVSDSGSSTVDILPKTLNIEITWPYLTKYAERVESGDILEFEKVMIP